MMNLRRAAIGMLTAVGLTIGLTVSFGPLGAQVQQPGPPPEQPASQQAQQEAVLAPKPLQQSVLQQANAVSPLSARQLGPFPAPVSQQSAGFGNYWQQFGALAPYMRQNTFHPARQQGFAVPANPSTSANPSDKKRPLSDDGDDASLSNWRKSDDVENDSAVPATSPPKRSRDEEEETRPVRRPKPKAIDEEEVAIPVKTLSARPAEEDDRTPERPTKTDGFGSEIFTKNASDPYIQYANFAPISLDAPQRMVNSRKIGLQYQVRNAGPSGVALVEVWRTCDGHKWEKFAEQANARPPFLVEVEKEGLYGFILIPRSGVGLARKAPTNGESPQLWVEVDLSAPLVKVNQPVVGTGRENGKLIITWSAKDKNLGPEPITLSYAEESTGEWKPIAAHIRNTGRYVWEMPARTPYRFLVRVHAVDRAGNVGSDQTLKPVIIDLSTPETVILGVDPVSR